MLAEIVWDGGMVVAIAIFSVPVVSVIATYWYKIEHVKSDNELKRSMVERGMSADEIERVITAKSPKR